MELSDKKLILTVPKDLVTGFFQLLQRGILIRAQIGGSIRKFLHETLGLSSELIEREISTIFLDGKPVDDIDGATVKDGCTLALSAAMPGLVGATLRRGGYYAPLRSDISYRGEKVTAPVAEGTIVLKVFNMVASALGPSLLEKGSYVQNDALRDFFNSRSTHFWEKCSAESSDGTILKQVDLITLQWGEPWIFLKVHVRRDGK